MVQAPPPPVVAAAAVLTLGVCRSQFLQEVRAVMGVPPWMVTVDARKTRDLHSGACLQILLHFTGPQANRLELDFSKCVWLLSFFCSVASKFWRSGNTHAASVFRSFAAHVGKKLVTN